MNPVRKTSDLLRYGSHGVLYGMERVGSEKDLSPLYRYVCSLKMGTPQCALKQILLRVVEHGSADAGTRLYRTSYCMAMRMAVPVEWVAASYCTDTRKLLNSLLLNKYTQTTP